MRTRTRPAGLTGGNIPRRTVRSIGTFRAEPHWPYMYCAELSVSQTGRPVCAGYAMIAETVRRTRERCHR